jgi:dipeptidase E
LNLVFYSGGEAFDNQELDKRFVRLNQGIKQITFIPADSYDGEHEYFDFIERFRAQGVKKFFYFPVDQPFSQTILHEAFSSDAIYLGGGNTFYFLQSLREKKLLGLLRAYAKYGHVVAGMSAGAIIMTSDIFMASYPKFDCDSNEVKLKNWKSLSLTQFDFFPHYSHSERYRRAFVSYSKKSARPLIATVDGAGLIIEGKHLEFVGSSTIYYRGKVLPLGKFTKELAT